MLGAVSRWLERRRRRRAAVVAAVHHFEAATGHPALAGGLSRVIGEDSDGYVVRICWHGTQKPPRRSWYLVRTDGVVVGELSFADVERYGKVYWL
jgi:hypothetical protein